MIPENLQAQFPEATLGGVLGMYISARNRLIRMKEMCTPVSNPAFYSDGMISGMEDSVEKWAQEVIAHYVLECYPLSDEQIMHRVETSAILQLKDAKLHGQNDQWRSNYCGFNNAKKRLIECRDKAVATLRDILQVPK